MVKDISKRLFFQLFSLSVLSLSLVIPSFTHAAEVDEITQAIKQKGARWIAGENSISKLPPEERIKRLGAILPLSSSAKTTLSAPLVSAATPSSLDWRNNLGNYVTPIRDQGACSACWAFATIAALESKVLITKSQTGVDINLSEQTLISCSGAGNCTGGTSSIASNYLQDTGVPGEISYPYTATDGNCLNAGANWQKVTYKISQWNYIATGSPPTIDTIKNALYTYGPLVTGMNVYDDLFWYIGGVYSHVSGLLRAYHNILIIGYDDTNKYFIVKNSWGTGWGESGYFRIDYSQINDVVLFGYNTIAYGSAISPPLIPRSPLNLEFR